MRAQAQPAESWGLLWARLGLAAEDRDMRKGSVAWPERPTCKQLQGTGESPREQLHKMFEGHDMGRESCLGVRIRKSFLKGQK